MILIKIGGILCEINCTDCKVIYLNTATTSEMGLHLLVAKGQLQIIPKLQDFQLMFSVRYQRKVWSTGG